MARPKKDEALKCKNVVHYTMSDDELSAYKTALDKAKSIISGEPSYIGNKQALLFIVEKFLAMA